MLLDFERLFAAAPSPYVLLDRDLRMVWANDAYLQVTGRDREAVVGRVMTEEFPSDPDSVHGRMLRGSFERVFRTGEPDHLPLIPYPITGRDGRVEERYWSATHTPVAGPDGTTAYVLQNTHDVTELYRSGEGGLDRRVQEADIARRAEAVTHRFLELDAWTSFFRTAFSQAPTFMAVLTGPDHVFQLANDAYLRLVGERRDLIGQTVREALPEIVGQGFIELLDRVYSSGEAVTLRAAPVTLMRLEDGGAEVVYLDFVYQPFSGADGRTIGIFVQGQDVTAQLQAEAQLREAEERFRTLAQTMPSQAWTARPDGGLDWVSDRVYAFTGLAEGGFVGAGWLAVLHPDDRERAGSAWAAAVAAGTPYEIEFRIRRSDGEYRWHLVRALPLRKDGKVLRWVGTNTDIDERIAAEAALEDLNATLEERVAQRNRELEEVHARLRHSQKLEAVGTLAGGVAHDFNNLLQAISGSLALAARELPEGPARQRVRAAMGSVERGAALSGQLLAFSRRLALNPQPVDLAALLDAMDMLIRSAAGEQIELTVSAADEAWPAYADANNIENAVLNLVVNARDALGGRGRISVSVGNVTLDRPVEDLEPGDYASVTVADDGPGMAPEVADKAFEPFFTTKPLGQGTGLGLATVYGFARQSGGGLLLDTAPGRGTRISLLLPRSRLAAPGRAGAAQPLGTLRGTERVLLVDDDEAVREATAALIGDLGYRVETCANADAARDLIDRDAAFDLLVTDVAMPGRTSAQDLATHAQAARPGLPVLFISGYPRDSIPAGGSSGPGRDFLPKPFSEERLARKLREMLAAVPAPRPAASAASRPLKVLVCEDEPLIRIDLIDMLAEMGASVTGTATGAEALERLAADAFDVMIMDLGLPDIGGEELARRARELRGTLPLVIATGRADVGAWRDVPDCLVVQKPFREAEVLAAVSRFRRPD